MADVFLVEWKMAELPHPQIRHHDQFIQNSFDNPSTCEHENFNLPSWVWGKAAATNDFGALKNHVFGGAWIVFINPQMPKVGPRGPKDMF